MDREESASAYQPLLYLDLIYELERVLTTRQTFLSVSRGFLRRLLSGFGTSGGAMFFFDPNQNRLVLQHQSGSNLENLYIEINEPSYKTMIQLPEELFTLTSPPQSLEPLLTEHRPLLKRLKAHVGVILRFKDNLLGLLCLGEKLPGEEYTPAEYQTLKIAGNLLSMTIYNDILFQEIRQETIIGQLSMQQLNELAVIEGLQELAIPLSSIEDSDWLVRELLNKALDLLSAVSGAVLIAQPHNPLLKMTHRVGIQENKFHLTKNHKTLKESLVKYRVSVINHYSDRRLQKVFGCPHLLAVPIKHQDDLFALLIIGERKKEYRVAHYEEIDWQLMTLFAQYAELTLENFQALRQLKDARENAERILDQTPIAIFTTNVLGRIDFANRTALKLFKKDLPELLKQHFQAVFQKDRHIIELIQQTQASGTKHAEQYATCQTISLDSLVHVLAAPLWDGNGKNKGTVVTLEEIVPENRIKDLFKRKVGNQLINELLENEDQFNLEGEHRCITAMMIRIRNLLMLAGKSEPQLLLRTLNEYFARLRKIIFKYKGTIHRMDPFEFIAVFGAPLNLIDHQQMGIRAALEALETLLLFNETRRENGKFELPVSIGIATGDVVVGGNGILEKNHYLIFGEAIDSARQLCRAARAYEILISPAPADNLGDLYQLEKCVIAPLEGEIDEVKAYRLSSPKQFIANQQAPEEDAHS